MTVLLVLACATNVDIADTCDALLGVFNVQFQDALVRCTVTSLEALKRRLTTRVQGISHLHITHAAPYYVRAVQGIYPVSISLMLR